MNTLVFGSTLLAALIAPRLAHADASAPPPDAAALVDAPKDLPAAPSEDKKLDGTTATVSAGGMSATGNSRQLALTGNGVVETLFDNNGISFSLIGNYGRSAPPGAPQKTSAENVQGRARYDRYLVERLSVFVINTGRYDRFQGLDLRYNLDPGVKYLLVREAATSLWAELGYDLEHDIYRERDRFFDVDGNPLPNAPLPKTRTDHSIRSFVGFKQAFNSSVTLSTGVEYLQSLVKTERSRVNFDALFAAKVGAGLALGLGFSARYDHSPLAGKETTDTATTVSLIYGFSSVVEPPKPAAPPCPEPAPAPAAPPPASAPAPEPVAPAPASTAPVPEPAPVPPAPEPTMPAAPALPVNP